jgi:hypothetical protein
VGHAPGSTGLLDMEASPSRVSQSSLKTGRGVSVGGVRGIIVEIMWS